MNTMESQPQIPDPKETVLAKIGLIRQEVALMGANNSEIPEIDAIIEQFRNDECTAQEALAAAHAIKESKQDYH